MRGLWDGNPVNISVGLLLECLGEGGTESGQILILGAFLWQFYGIFYGIFLVIPKDVSRT